MELYHYTTIENLALILSSKKIRFNRLDHFDDIDEGRIESCGRKLGQYFFASCWTRVAEESIPLWKMYTNDGVGVRLSVSYDMFCDYPIPDDPYNIIKNVGIRMSKIPTNEVWGTGKIIIPVIMENNGFLKDIVYTDNAIEETRRCLNICTMDNKTNFNFSYDKIGTYKNKRWAFEEESRFIIPIFPVDMRGIISKRDWNNLMGYTIYNNVKNDIEEYYLRMKDDVINNIKVTLSPKAGKEHLIIVQSLLKQYTNAGTVEYSHLRDKVRLK